jgi:xanthine dehydrogenase YagS FAD-binding subunit
MKPFQYATALSPASARDLLGDNGAYLAGGNDLLAMMKDYLVSPKILVNIKSLPGSNKIEPGAKSWAIGNNVTVAQLEDHAELKKVFPGLQQAAVDVASRQIRNVATVGGNLAQHSRCWYYRHRDTLCLKRGGDTCFARQGENKYHSLFTGNPCISPVVSSLAVALTALEASIVVQRGDKQLRMTMAEFYAKAWDNPIAHHSLEHGDLILKVEIPVQEKRSVFMQVSEKAMFDWALVSCAVAAKVDGKKLSQVRVVFGSVSPVPYQSQPANTFLEGKTFDDEIAAKAANLILEKAQAHAENGYKIPIMRALVRRTLQQLTA